jgi:hypothetical protein
MGLLQKTDEREAYLALLGNMARTPRGSWAGHPSFGFHNFFSDSVKEGLSPESRARMAEVTAKEINAVLSDLGLARYRVASLALEPFERDTRGNGHWMGHQIGSRGVILRLCESGSDLATEYPL